MQTLRAGLSRWIRINVANISLLLACWRSYGGEDCRLLPEPNSQIFRYSEGSISNPFDFKN
jgi:hypothetical protein